MTYPWSLDAVRANAAAAVPVRDLEPPCRCGAVDEKPLGTKPQPVDPPADLRHLDVDLTTNTLWRGIACLSCHHPIHKDAPCVIATGDDYATRLPHFHPQCCVI
jgi:hypothetical protein